MKRGELWSAKLVEIDHSNRRRGDTQEFQKYHIIKNHLFVFFSTLGRSSTVEEFNESDLMIDLKDKDFKNLTFWMIGLYLIIWGF